MTTLPQTTSFRPQRALPGNQIAMPGPAGLGMNHQAANQNAMTASDVWRVLRANVWLLLSALILSGILGYGLNSWLAARHSRYTATGLIAVRSKPDLITIGMSSVGVNGAELEYELGTQVKLLQHDRLFSKLLENSEPVRNTEWFKQFVSYRGGQQVVDAEAAKADLAEHLDVRVEPNSRLISVRMNWSVPKDCQTIVTEIVNQHINDQKMLADADQGERSAALEQLKLNYESQIRDIMGRMNEIAISLGSQGVQVGTGASSKDFELQALVGEQLKAQAFLGAAEAKLETFKKQLETNSAPELQEALQKDPQYSDYRREVDILEQGYIEQLDSEGETHPRTKSLKHRLDMMRHKKSDLEDDIRSRTAELILANLENDHKAADSALKRVLQRISDVRTEIRGITKSRNDYVQSQNDLTMLKEKIDKVKEQQDRLGFLGGKSQLVNWAQYPDLPDHPTFPKWFVIIPLTIMTGLALSLGIAFLRELTDTTVRTPRDIARVGQLTLLGMIPHEDDDPEAASARLPLAIFEAPHSIIAEQFRHVRTRLQHTASLDTTRSILVTGCSPKDGKSTVACNLAAGLALNGRRILLVDANFRRPELHNIFNMPNDVGFGDVLNEIDMFQDVVSETEVPNLSIITSGTKPSNPTELLESQLLIDFIERALEEYDHIIFDSGPLLMVSDSIALAPRVDGVVTVVRATGNSRGMLGRMRDELRRLKAEHLGVVLNAVRVHGGGYYGPMIKNYYAYQNG